MHETKQYIVCLTADFQMLGELRDLISHAGTIAGLTEKETHDLTLAVDEAATNIIEHAARKTPCDITCLCTSDTTEHTLLVELQYNASQLFAADPPTALEIEERLRGFRRGGLGIYLMHRLVDSIDYLHQEGQNRIRLLKKHAAV